MKLLPFPRFSDLINKTDLFYKKAIALTRDDFITPMTKIYDSITAAAKKEASQEKISLEEYSAIVGALNVFSTAVENQVALHTALQSINNIAARFFHLKNGDINNGTNDAKELLSLIARTKRIDLLKEDPDEEKLILKTQVDALVKENKELEGAGTIKPSSTQSQIWISQLQKIAKDEPDLQDPVKAAVAMVIAYDEIMRLGTGYKYLLDKLEYMEGLMAYTDMEEDDPDNANFGNLNAITNDIISKVQQKLGNTPAGKAAFIAPIPANIKSTLDEITNKINFEDPELSKAPSYGESGEFEGGEEGEDLDVTTMEESEESEDVGEEGEEKEEEEYTQEEDVPGEEDFPTDLANELGTGYGTQAEVFEGMKGGDKGGAKYTFKALSFTDWVERIDNEIKRTQIQAEQTIPKSPQSKILFDNLIKLLGFKKEQTKNLFAFKELVFNIGRNKPEENRQIKVIKEKITEINKTLRLNKKQLRDNPSSFEAMNAENQALLQQKKLLLKEKGKEEFNLIRNDPSITSEQKKLFMAQDALGEINAKIATMKTLIRENRAPLIIEDLQKNISTQTGIDHLVSMLEIDLTNTRAQRKLIKKDKTKKLEKLIKDLKDVQGGKITLTKEEIERRLAEIHEVKTFVPEQEQRKDVARFRGTIHSDAGRIAQIFSEHKTDTRGKNNFAEITFKYMMQNNEEYQAHWNSIVAAQAKKAKAKYALDLAKKVNAPNLVQAKMDYDVASKELQNLHNEQKNIIERNIDRDVFSSAKGSILAKMYHTSTEGTLLFANIADAIKAGAFGTDIVGVKPGTPDRSIEYKDKMIEYEKEIQRIINVVYNEYIPNANSKLIENRVAEFQPKYHEFL